MDEVCKMHGSDKDSMLFSNAAARRSTPGQVMWDFWWKKITLERILRFPLPVIISPTALCSLLIQLSTI
jgi:hypothetical protein